MRVLMLGWELPPHNSGGLGVACYGMCRALADRKINIDFILPFHADYGIDFMHVRAASPQRIEAALNAGVAYDSRKYIKPDGTTEGVSLFELQKVYEYAVIDFVSYKNYDIIHAHDWLTFRAGVRAKEKAGIPVFLHVHSIETDRSGGHFGNPYVREIERTSFLAADRIIAVSEHTKQSISQEYAISLNKIDVVHNSIEFSELLPKDQNDDQTYRYLAELRTQGYRVVANVGRLTIQKGLPNLLRAAQIVITKCPKTMFLIVGSGEQFTELLELAAELGIAKNVIFTSFQRGKPWRDAFSIADLFVMPSISEPFGLTPLEAIGYGTPSLISKQSGVSEVLRHALKVDYWDINEMANEIIAVVQNDELHDELLGGASRELSELSWKKSAEKICSLYSRFARAGTGIC